MARILIVDDEAEIVDLVRFLLERDGHVVMEARDGREGLEMAEKERPDLIVLDIMMPEMDGYTMNNHMLAHAQGRDIPVIVLTAKGGLQETSVMAPNIRYHVEKPFDPKELKDFITQSLVRPPSGGTHPS